MGYMHIENLYKTQDILLFKECYALEKIHGTSAHITYKIQDGKPMISFHSGGVDHLNFVALFDKDVLMEKMKGIDRVDVYGEAYGGKCMKMSGTYGKDLRFVVFDVRISDCWLSVPQAEEFAKDLALEFVSYEKISTDLDEIEKERDLDSVQSVRNGMGEGHKREGVVLRPLIELRKNNGDRIISKHKGNDFKETKTMREVDPEKMKILAEANAIADEWVTPMRLEHVLDKIEDPCMEKMREIIAAMCEDVQREAEGEIVWDKNVAKAVGKATALAMKEYFQKKLRE
jgi:hypothetical protein